MNIRINACYYRNYSKFWDRQAWPNSVDPDQTPQNAASDQGLHCLPLIQHLVVFFTPILQRWKHLLSTPPAGSEINFSLGQVW